MLKILRKIKSIHIQAILVLIVYLIFSKINLVSSAASKYLWVSFLSPFIYGSLSGLVFLYLFSHEDFFPIAREIEKKERKAEQRWQERLSHHGKVFICFFIGAATSPVLCALAVRLLIHKHKFWYKYAVIFVSEIFSTILNVGLLKGLIRVI